MLLSYVLLSLVGVALAVDLCTHGSDFKPDHVLVATLQNYSVACTTRETVLINGTSPGPDLRIRPGETSWIRVYNDMTDRNLTVHWHGLSMRVAQFSDGTPLASQWPIPPMHFFDYELHPTANESGTYFYHSHVDFQAVSAFGALIVEDRHKSPYKYDEERTVLISDYFNQTDKAISAGLQGIPFKWSGETNAILVNGKGITNWKPTLNTSECTLAVIDVDPGKTYRFRSIGGTALTLATWAIEDHDDLVIIAADGEYTRPAPTNHLQIASGQRFDFLLKTKTKQELAAAGKDTYYIQLENRARPTNTTAYAVLRYNRKADTPAPPSKKVLTLPQQYTDWMEYTLEPFGKPDFPSLAQVNRQIYVKVLQDGSATANVYWTQDGLNWTEYTHNRPYLVEIYEDGEAAVPSIERARQYGGWDPAFDAWPVATGEIIDIILENSGSASGNGSFDVHPFHAHGSHYYDLGSGTGTYDAVANERRFANYTPARRDTTMLYKYKAAGSINETDGWRAWRLRVDDPGVWMIHCHILQHMIMGMQMVWVFGNASEIQKIPHYMATGYLDYGGSAYGNETFEPKVVHQFS